MKNAALVFFLTLCCTLVYAQPVSNHITDSVTQTNTKILGEAPASSMANVYQSRSQVATPLRSISLQLLNDTNVAVTVEGFYLIQGQWQRLMQPEQGQVVAPHTTIEYAINSFQVGVGAEAVIILGSKSGMVHVHFGIPWMGPEVHLVTRMGNDDFTVVPQVSQMSALSHTLYMFLEPRN